VLLVTRKLSILIILQLSTSMSIKTLWTKINYYWLGVRESWIMKFTRWSSLSLLILLEYIHLIEIYFHRTFNRYLHMNWVYTLNLFSESKQVIFVKVTPFWKLKWSLELWKNSISMKLKQDNKKKEDWCNKVS
jgi:hypothetical protein